MRDVLGFHWRMEALYWCWEESWNYYLRTVRWCPVLFAVPTIGFSSECYFWKIKLFNQKNKGRKKKRDGEKKKALKIHWRYWKGTLYWEANAYGKRDRKMGPTFWYYHSFLHKKTKRKNKPLNGFVQILTVFNSRWNHNEHWIECSSASVGRW